MTRPTAWLYAPATGTEWEAIGNMTAAMLRALLEALAADPATMRAVLASIEADLASEAGRVLSGKNEATVRAAVQALQAVLAQLDAQPADPNAAPGAPGAAPTQPAAPVRPFQQAAGATTDDIAQESALPVSEAAVKDGKSLIRIITPGWGSSGFYSPAVLERDSPAAFPRGTKMFWDHPPQGDNRPERSLRDLAAELTEDAKWLPAGPEGPGVYSRARVFKAYQPAVEELAPHIGVSIRASAAFRHGQADGKAGPIIERLLPSPTNSVDFVTIPGRGGRIASLFEAARGRNAAESTEGVDDVSAEELKAAQDKAAEAEARAARAETAAAVLAAGAVATEVLRTVDIPDAAKVRIREAMASNPPMKDGALDADAFKAAVTAEATKEKAYIAALLGTGTVRGMGSTEEAATGSATGAPAGMAADFQRLGLTESAAKTAATGRRN